MISVFALIEFDVVLRSRGLSAQERSEKHALLLFSYPLAAERVTRPSPSTFVLAARLEEDYNLDYFDSLVAADAMMHDGVIISTDVEMDRIPNLRRVW